MRGRMSVLGLTVFACLCGVSAMVLAAAAEVSELKEAPGRDLTLGRCIVCHSVEYIPSNAPAMNRAGWQKSIQKMRERFGAPLSDEEARQILDYLDANYSGKS
jgi:sulfite dehydrogenase (cytochrome) subunit B